MALTLAQYAEARRLPVAFLKELGLRDTPRGVAIPIYREDGSLYAIRTRERMDGQPKVRQQAGMPLLPYGLNRLASGRHLIIVEGESDCHALWLHNFAALGFPGASSWKREWRTYFTFYETISLYDEGDLASRKLADRVATDWPGLRSLKVGNYKDPAALHAAQPDDFETLMWEAMSRAPVIRPPRRRTARPRPAARSYDGPMEDIVTVVERHTRLRREGTGLVGLCPLHEERQPSFSVSPEKNAWYCHGACARGGGVRAFKQAVGEAT